MDPSEHFRLIKIRSQKQNCFLLLASTKTGQTIQAIGRFAGKPDVLAKILAIPMQSIVKIDGLLRESPFAVTGADVKDYEFVIEDVTPVSRAHELPFDPACVTLETFASETLASWKPNVTRPTRVLSRALDLRAPEIQRVFKLKSDICWAFQSYLHSKDFVQIHTPKLLGMASEGGCDVFEVKYFDRKAYLAQSPQLYKQLAICGDMHKVYEIAPAFRAENTISQRHLTEFTSLDVEMTIESFDDLTTFVRNLVDHIVHTVGFDFKVKTIRYIDAVKSLGLPETYREDFTGEQEKAIAAAFDCSESSLMVTHYPVGCRPFYTMIDPSNPEFTLSFDIFLRGREICSGAQRVHDYEALASRCGDKKSLADYVEFFKYGTPPHGGCGIGLERVVTLLLDISNIREGTLCPRDPETLTP